jgi:hypothetical protein
MAKTLQADGDRADKAAQAEVSALESVESSFHKFDSFFRILLKALPQF